jgi:hypothetical protein
VKLLPISKGEFTKVDDELYEFVSQWKWYLDSKGYAARGIYYYTESGQQKHKVVRMHREVLAYVGLLLSNQQVDHINHDKLDNRLFNLRVATAAQNTCNQGLKANNKSGYKGVWFNKTTGKWIAKIKVSGRTITLGRFLTGEDAACAYNKAALEYHGEYAYLNKVLCNFDGVSA